MIAVVATIKTKPGTGAEFEAVAKELVAEVNAKEPGCKLYQLHKSDAADTYVFLERYVDQAAIETHRGTPHFKDLGKKMGAFMDGRPDVKVLQEI
jgi:quinol monooxygenase YgiN